MDSKRPRVIPGPGELPNLQEDVREAFAVLKAGGIVICPNDTGYALISCNAEGIERGFRAKQRKPGHTLAMLGSYETHRDIHILPPEKFEMTRLLTMDMSAFLGIVAPYKKDHPRIKALSPSTLDRATKGGTLGIGVVEGKFMRELAKLCDEEGLLMVGSSANLTGRGQKFRVEDIEPEVFNAADLIVDHGLQRYYMDQLPGTIIDFEAMHVLRQGAGYNLFRDRMEKFYGIELPATIQKLPN
ncbi:DHBP synthase RibB-like alpha/beta domain-containing protein [Nemania sp. FL0916]|nr:DHBP synthase RibB-like alpha/beta domain-containing protein [Nemania sp. FL0916]